MQINLTIEFMAVALPIGFFLLWALWYYITIKYHKRKYKPYINNDNKGNDKGKPYTRKEGGSNPRFAKREPDTERASEPEVGGIQMVSTPDRSIIDETGIATDGKSRTNPFRRKK